MTADTEKTFWQIVGELHGKLAIKRTPTVYRDAYLDYMTFKRKDCAFFVEIFGPLIGLKEEWAAQGASPEEIDMSAFRFTDTFKTGVPVHTGFRGGEPDVILSNTEEELLGRDGLGRTLRLCKKSATLPLPLTHPVHDMADWLRLKPHYQFCEERFAAGWEDKLRAARAAGHVICLGMPGGFDEPRQLLGEEELCYAYYEQPELITDILITLGDTMVEVIRRVKAVCPIDELGVHEDMAGKSGSLAGPAQIKEFIAPYYRRVWDAARDAGARLFSQDSDGNMNGVIGPLIDAGINVLYPMEPAAGMDMVKVRAEFGTRLAIMGGLDKFIIQKGRAAIDAELEYKIPAMLRTGGIIFGLDHRIPAGSSLENYRYYHRRAWEIIEREQAARG